MAMISTTFYLAFLAQIDPETGKTPPDFSRVIIWGCIFIGVITAAWGVIMLLRRRLQDPDAPARHDPGFSLSELRAMRDRGEITPEEYERTRALVVEKVKAKLAEPRPEKPRGRGDDDDPTLLR